MKNIKKYFNDVLDFYAGFYKFDGFYRGINLGGWLSQGSLEKEHLDTFITEKDIYGLVKLRVKYIGQPTLWVRRLFS